MPIVLSWNEIRDRATKFAREWKDETREIGEYQTFWNDFFEIFGVRRRSVAIYQKAVDKISGNPGFIDLFWPGKLIVEHKTAGRDLGSAFLQAADYMVALPEEGRPRYIIVSDYQNIRLYDLETEDQELEFDEFPLKELPKHIRQFAFIAGYEVRKYRESDPVNRKAVRTVVKLYRALLTGIYPPEHLSKLLVRLVFCFFADDTAIFPKDAFYRFLFYMSREDGNDFGSRLTEVFQTLNTKEDERQTNLDEDLDSLPYVNGGLFAEILPLPSFNKEMRRTLLDAAEFDWGSVSPAIFGSMFQFVMDVSGDEDLRHDFGAHYTSEKNILKLIDGLFLDDLKKELEESGKNQQKLQGLWEKIGNITLLDPACGCGNFLVVAYRELRRIELDIFKLLYVKELQDGQQQGLPLDVRHLSKFSVERMFGIEILPFPAEIARLSLWLADHLANMELGDLFGKPFAKLPLLEQPHILCANALTTSWEDLVPKNKLTYILGNPPFIAKQDRDSGQRDDMDLIFSGIRGAGELDYVAAWYMKAINHITDTNIRVAFVSTNSITQGEQVGILWPELIRRGVVINFAHRTFRWSNEAPGQAAVHCVIIGFSLNSSNQKYLYDYDEPNGEPHQILATNINPYLVDASDVVVLPRRHPISNVPEAKFGSMPNDAGALLFDDEVEKNQFILTEPEVVNYVRPLISAKEYLNGKLRYCLWLKGIPPEELRKMPEVMKRIEVVRLHRDISTRPATKALATTPFLFGEDRQPDTDYVLIPRVSSERRNYVPLSFFGPDNIAGDTCIIVPSASLYHFGVLQSVMHMTWMRSVCGRMKSDYRYSNELVYNNFPWPKDVSEELKKDIETKAQDVLSARQTHPTSTLADLYDPLTMPTDLLDAHKALDHTVDRAYGVRNFESDQKRLEFLFNLYQEYTGVN